MAVCPPNEFNQVFSPADSRRHPKLAVGGTEGHLLTLLPRLAAEGYAVTIFTTQGAGPLDPACRKSGIEIVNAPVKSTSRFKPWGWLMAARSLHRLLRRQRPDIVHFFLSEAYIIGGLCALLAGVSPRVMSRRSLNNYQRKHKIGAAVERFLHRKMTAVLANSQAVYRDLEQEGVRQDCLHIIYNGIDIESFAPPDKPAVRDSLGIPEGALVCICVANLIPYKGHSDMIEAFGLAAKNLPRSWRLLIVGSGNAILEDLRAQADARELSENILWLGPRTDIADLLNIADIGVLASHEEGMSNSVLEGMASGLPMIVTDVGGNREIIDNSCGVLIPPHSPAELANALTDLANDDARRQKIAAAARCHIAANFSLDNCVSAYRQLYSGLVGQGQHIPEAAENQDR